jgi:hypothetical protein
MARWIEIRSGDRLPESFTIKVGDLLMFSASGGRLRSDENVLELLGHFIPAVLGDNWQILSPVATPNSVFFIARASGVAVIEIVKGDPWHASTTTRHAIRVED